MTHRSLSCGQNAWQLPGGTFGTGQSLLEYNPAAGTSTVLLGPPVNGGGVIDVVSYPGQS